MSFNIFFLSSVALVFLVAAGFSYRRKWNFGFSFSLVVFAFFSALALPQTQSFLRTAVWAAFVTSVEKFQAGLASVNTTIEDIRVHLEEEQAVLERQQAQLDDVQERILQAQSGLDKQAEQLADTDELVKAFYEKKVTDRFQQTKDSDRLIVLDHGQGKTSVYFLLRHTPIRATVDINYDVYDQLSDAWEIDGNVVTLRWRDPPQNFYRKRVLVSYVPDPTSEPLYKVLSKKEDRVFADGVPMLSGYVSADPIFPAFMSARGGPTFRIEDVREFLREYYANGSTE